MWQVIKLHLNADGKILKRVNVGIPAVRERAEQVLQYHETKERRARIVYAITEAEQ